MDTKLQSAIDILHKYNQEHLLDFYDELNDTQKSNLLNQILSIDYNLIKNLYEDSKKDSYISPNRISPILYTEKSKLNSSDISFYKSIGDEIIKNGELAIITLAGGQGTRLGYKGPKGTYEIDVPPKKSIFEFTYDKLQDAFNKYNIYIPWYIMTSPSNDLATKKFFEDKNFFGYPKEKIFFFKQSTLPIIDTDAKIILDNLSLIKEASNGNGDVFRSFDSAGFTNDLLSKNIKWIFICGIDNIILDIVDPLFIGLTIANNSDIASKSVSKLNITSDDWIFANVDNLPCIIDPKDLTSEMLTSKNINGSYNYNQINILAHLFNVKSFLYLKDINLQYHRAFKKNDYINEDGMKVVPSAPNSFKFEKFIFDSFKYFPNFTLLEVNPSLEFSPIKSFKGDQTPETALELYLNKFNLPH